MENRKIRVGITHGDLNGVGYEVIFKTFAESTMFDLCTPVIYGSPRAAAYHCKALKLDTPFSIVNDSDAIADDVLNLVPCVTEEVKIDFGQPSEESGAAAFRALEVALDDYKKGIIDVLVTAPINKNTIQREGFHFPGHTEYIAQKMEQDEQPLMILMNDTIRVALVTTHLPVKDIAEAIIRQRVEEKIELLNNSLKRDFGISCPRIAVLALNPHAGDNGLLGTEESEEIIPAIENMSEKGILCYGPYAADGYFGSQMYKHFDGTLAMYHDQGLAPFKALCMGNGVNFTAGLSIVRTSPDHGTAYDIAGKGIADESSFRQAIYTAIDVYRNRQRDDEAHQNPLRKQYHEKRDDSDKLKLDAPSADEI